MPNTSTPRPAGGLRYSGVFKDMLNGQTELYDDGILAQTLAQAVSTGAGAQSASAYSTAGAFTSTLVGSAFVGATGNVAIGNPAAFATTQPQGAVIMGGTSRSGIAPVGAVATSGAIFASDTVVMKIIAAGTANNVET